MHPSGKTKLGFYPLPVTEARRLRTLLSFPPQFSAVDPCAGDGVAFAELLSTSSGTRYGIEIDAYRAEQARGLGIAVLQAHLMEVRCSAETLSLVYLNPPYDFESGTNHNQRLEAVFLDHVYRWLTEPLDSGQHSRLYAWLMVSIHNGVQPTFQIGELARRTALSIDVIRFYERRKLPPPAFRSAGRFRLYTTDDIERLRFVRMQRLGFSLEEIKQLMAISCRPSARLRSGAALPEDETRRGSDEDSRTSAT